MDDPLIYLGTRKNAYSFPKYNRNAYLGIPTYASLTQETCTQVMNVPRYTKNLLVEFTNSRCT